MSTNAAKLEFPGHFSSPSHSPPFIPVGETRRLSELDAMSDVHLPGAYPASPKKSSVGGNNDVLSKPSEETTRQLSDAEEYANRATQSPTASSERFQEEKNNRDFSQEHGRGDLVAMENLSMNDRPDSFQEEPAHHTPETQNSHLPSRIDVQSVSPPPELPARSPLRSGFGTQNKRGNSKGAQNISLADSQEDSFEDKHTILEHAQLEQQPQPQPQPIIHTTPTQPHVNEPPLFSAAANPADTLQKSMGVDLEATTRRNEKDAQEASEDDNDDFIDAMEDFQLQGDNLSAAAGRGKEAEKHAKHTRGNSLMLKMKRTLSKAGRHVS